MTIGIAASGHSAGAAVCDALLGAELLGRGSIKGFAVFTVFDSDGAPQWRTTQDGGLGTLELPDAWASAKPINSPKIWLISGLVVKSPASPMGSRRR